jgi:hypothetical protein
MNPSSHNQTYKSTGPFYCVVDGRARRDEIQKATERIVPWVFFFHERAKFHKPGDALFHTDRLRACDALRREWSEAAKAAGFPDRIPLGFRRPPARNMERAGVPRSVAMALGGWRSESMYRRYAIASEADLRDGVSRLASFRKTVARVHQ